MIDFKKYPKVLEFNNLETWEKEFEGVLLEHIKKSKQLIIKVLFNWEIKWDILEYNLIDVNKDKNSIFLLWVRSYIHWKIDKIVFSPKNIKGEKILNIFDKIKSNKVINESEYDSIKNTIENEKKDLVKYWEKCYKLDNINVKKNKIEDELNITSIEETLYSINLFNKKINTNKEKEMVVVALKKISSDFLKMWNFYQVSVILYNISLFISEKIDDKEESLIIYNSIEKELIINLELLKDFLKKGEKDNVSLEWLFLWFLAQIEYNLWLNSIPNNDNNDENCIEFF